MKRVYAKTCYTCMNSLNINTLKYFYMGVNLVPYNHPSLDDEGMSAISLFNNDYGYKIFNRLQFLLSFFQFFFGLFNIIDLNIYSLFLSLFEIFLIFNYFLVKFFKMFDFLLEICFFELHTL